MEEKRRGSGLDSERISRFSSDFQQILRYFQFQILHCIIMMFFASLMEVGGTNDTIPKSKKVDVNLQGGCLF